MSTKPTDELLDHAYDGIQEFDNPIPGWWTWLWIGTIIFSGAYFFYYHVASFGVGVIASYERDLAIHQESNAIIASESRSSITEEHLRGLSEDEASVAAGAEKYAAICLACHGANGEGTVGPNLTDDYWLHADGTLMGIRKIVAIGVPEKGMPAWEKIMSEDELNNVVAYISSIIGTNIEGKPPQGEKLP